MGAAVSVIVKVAIPVISAVVGLVGLFKDHNPEPNPVLTQIEEAQRRGPYPLTPYKWPTDEEITIAKSRTRDEEGNRELLHFGISGVVKSGKSSLLNSFRGLTPRDPKAARVASSEATRGITRYNDPRSEYPFAWYDIAGFDTASAPADNYFNAHGLFALDCILVLIKDSFRKSDAALIDQCRRFSIPTYIVRSFSDQHIRNILDDGAPSYEDARAEYIRDAEENARNGLADFGLDGQRLYLVNRHAMLSLVSGSSPMPDSTIHEAELLRDVLQECKKRRLRNI